MNKEREFLKKLRYASLLENDLRKELEELLAQPEQDLEVLKKDWVNFGYEAGRKSALSKQEPVAWCQIIEGRVQDLLTSFEMKDWLYDKSWIALYTAPPKREPLSGIEIPQGFQADDATHQYSYCSGVDFAEKAHGIGGGK